MAFPVSCMASEVSQGAFGKLESRMRSTRNTKHEIYAKNCTMNASSVKLLYSLGRSEKDGGLFVTLKHGLLLQLSLSRDNVQYYCIRSRTEPFPYGTMHIATPLGNVFKYLSY